MGILWTILPLCFCLNLQAGFYDIKDLEYLETQKSYKEFLDHAHDIRPSKRGKHWREMVGNMSIGFIKNQLAQKKLTKENFDYIDELSRWPTLKDDDYFKHKRRDFALNYFKSCTGITCKSDLLGFWYSVKKHSGETAKNLALSLKRIDPSSNLTPFLTVIGHDSYALYHCKKDWIQQEIFGLLTEPLRMEKDEKLKNLMSKLVGAECWKSLRPTIHQTLTSRTGLKQDYAYKLLNAREDLSQEWKDFYYVSYFLGTPSPGKTFNESWNRIKKLGQNYDRRIKVLKKIKTVDPLPGKLFSTIDNGKKQTLIKYFKKNFPEYMDYYSKTCISYLSGTIDFTNGNPTPDCDNLFAGKFIEDKIRTKYSALKKISK